MSNFGIFTTPRFAFRGFPCFQVKLKGGEYVALELINVTYNNHELINADVGGQGDHRFYRSCLKAWPISADQRRSAQNSWDLDRFLASIQEKWCFHQLPSCPEQLQMPGFVVLFKDTSFAGVCSFASHEIDRPVLLAQCNLAAHRCCQGAIKGLQGGKASWRLRLQMDITWWR